MRSEYTKPKIVSFYFLKYSISDRPPAFVFLFFNRPDTINPLVIGKPCHCLTFPCMAVQVILFYAIK